jgi:two-component system CheB/CheR fusion protein
VDDLLDVTRIGRGKMQLILGPLDMHEAIRYALEIARPDIEAKEQQLQVSLKASEHDLEGDAARLQQVIWNLLKNASKFTPSEGKIRLSTRNSGDSLIIRVSDNGIGIEPGALHRIFDAFSQANSEISRQFGGLGLGLAISRATVEAHGGTICARSAGVDRGATFEVSLPLGPQKALALEAAPE